MVFQPREVGSQCGAHVCGRRIGKSVRTECPWQYLCALYYDVFVIYPQGAKKILSEHNRLRRLVSSGGTRLPRGAIPDLQWDERLARGAQAWADRCSLSHDGQQDRARRCGFRSRGAYVGQNLAMTRCALFKVR